MIEKRDRSGREELPAGEGGSYANGRASRSAPGRIVCDVESQICVKMHITFNMALLCRVGKRIAG
jgi:hypothetical protein